MKAFHQAPPVVGCTFLSNQKTRISFSSGPYHHCSRQNHLVASKDTFKCNEKYERLMVTTSSLSGMSYERFPESVWDTLKDSSSESLKNMQDAKQNVLAEDMNAQFIESIVFDKTLYKYEILDIKNSMVKSMKQQGLMSAADEDEILRALDKIEQAIVQGKFEWRDGRDVHTNIIEALVNMVGEHAKVLTATNRTDRCLSVITTWYKDCIVPITTRIKRIQVALMLLAIRNEGLVLPGSLKAGGSISLNSIILPIVKLLADDANYLGYCHDLITSSSNFGFPVTDSYFVRSRIGYIADRINYDVPEHLMQMVRMLVSLQNLPSFIPNDEVVTTFDTFQDRFCPNQRTDDGFYALDNSLNTNIFCSTHGFDIEGARFYLFSSFDNVLEMVDMSIKFAEGISVNQEISPRGPSGAVSFARFLESKGLSLETSYAVVSLCLKKRCQPWELTPRELQRIGFPCDSLEEIHQARGLLLQGEQIVFDSLTDRDTLAELLFWCGNLEIDPRIFC
ncbi:unnamed protein product [Urochloa decumbens]|uniref:Uncharacterized protein n=1 Tax=Urochloa decumbens TaxID=240449 RepID=A0ABC8Y843_9POAL